MVTYHINESITECRINFDPGDYTYGWCVSLTADIKFTYCKTGKYTASLINIKDKVERESD